MKIPQFNFNESGTRFDSEILTTMKEKILSLPVVEAAEYVDVVTYIHVCEGKPIQISDQEVDAVIRNKSWNTTTVGNLAFVAWYHPDYNLRGRAAYLIEKIRKSVSK